VRRAEKYTKFRCDSVCVCRYEGENCVFVSWRCFVPPGGNCYRDVACPLPATYWTLLGESAGLSRPKWLELTNSDSSNYNRNSAMWRGHVAISVPVIRNNYPATCLQRLETLQFPLFLLYHGIKLYPIHKTEMCVHGLPFSQECKNSTCHFSARQ
jgi:hypothetical protein